MKKVVAIVFSIFMLLIVSACNKEEVSITNVSFDQSVLESSYEIADFSIEDYFLTIEFSDGSSQQVAITTAMISSSDFAKLSVSGTQVIEVLYHGFKVLITVTLLDPIDELTVLLTSIYTTGVSEGTIIDMTYEEWLATIRGEQGLPGVDGREVLFQVSDGYIQWQYTGDSTWTNLVSLSTLTGADGSNGADGVDGREVLFQVSDGYIQWQYTGDSTWTNLVSLSTLTGADGSNGADGVDGREVLFQVSDGYIQWQYTGDSTWTNLVELSTLNGVAGPSAYDIYIKYHPEYQGTEEQWMDDLVNGRLGNLHKVIFDSNGGTPIDFQTIRNGDKALNPGNPTKDGYSFLGWYYEDIKWVFVGYTITENMTLTAHYNPIEYALEYHLDGGTFVTEVIPTSYTIETVTFGIPEPTKDGYIFSGWTYEGQNLPIHNVTITKGSLGSLELTANWVDLSTMSYNATLTDTPTGYIINTIYFLTTFDDDSFLLVTGSIYSDGTITFSADYGTTIFLDNNVIELDFAEEEIISLYILVNGSSMSFCNEDGTPVEITGPTQDGAYSIGDFTSEELEIGYGYYDLSFYPNADKLQSFYMNLYQDCQEFAMVTTDYQAPNGSNLFNEYDMIEYGLSIEDGFKVIKVFLLDHPEYFWISTTFSGIGSLISVYIIPEYQSYAARLAVENGLSEILVELDSIITSDMSDLDIAYYLHDYIISRIDYAYELDGVSAQDDYWAHNIEGVVLSKGAVCEGYAEAYKLLLDHFGIYNLLVTGESGGEAHEFNLVEIDGKFYVIDLTWDDPGNDEISLTYFGMGYPSITQTHTFDSSDSIGIEYLYHLPFISNDDITLVELYYNEDKLGWFVSIESAFEEMIDSNGDYTLLLVEYDRVGSLLWSSSTRIYDIPSFFPIVNSIMITGSIIDLSNEEIGSGWYSMIPLTLDNDINLMSDVTFKNVFINSNESTMYIGSFRLTFLGANIIHSNLVGDLGSLLYLDEFYGNGTEYWGNIMVDTINIVGTTLQFRGDFLDIDDLYRHQIDMGTYYLNATLLLTGDSPYVTQHVIIDCVHLDEVAELLNIQGVYDLDVTINEVIGLLAPSVLIRVESLDYMPSIKINSSINNDLVVMFVSTTKTIWTDLNGKQVVINESSINIADYESVVFTIPQIDMSQVKIWQDGRNLSNLFDKNELGELIKVRDTYEEIIDGVLFNVTTSELLLDYVVPENVTEIGFNAFIGCTLSSIVIPEGVTTIGDFAFQGQTYLSYIELPSTITSIGGFAFTGTYATILLNTGIESISPNAFSDGNTLLISSSESDFGFEMISMNTQFLQILWNYTGMINEVGYHYAVSSDGYAVLVGIDNYSDNIVLPSSVQGYELIYFASMVFYSSTIKQITLSNTLLAIPPRAFQDCEMLNAVIFESTSKITSIGLNAFYGVELDSIIIPISVSTIGSSAFGYFNFNEIYDMVIYVESTHKPDNWHSYWVGNNKITVVWGYVISE